MSKTECAFVRVISSCLQRTIALQNVDHVLVCHQAQFFSTYYIFKCRLEYFLYTTVIFFCDYCISANRGKLEYVV